MIGMVASKARRTAAAILVGWLLVVASACATGGDGSPGSSAPPSSSGPSAPSAGVAEKWTKVPLTNVRDGSTFQIADFKGRTVFVETMAIWCGNCRAQQGLSAAALPKLSKDVVYIVLDVEESEAAVALRRYADQYRFPFVYAVAPAELSRALVRDFGDQVLNPVATPIIVIAPDGRATKAADGFKNIKDLIDLAREHGG